MDRASVDLIRSLAVLAEPPGAHHARLADVLRLGSVPTADAYSDVFLFQVHPYASVHLGAEGMLGGEARERVAGFWRAVGATPPAEPDHLAALLGLYATLRESAEARGRAPEEVLVDQARGALMHEHIAPWAFAFLDRVSDLTDGPYARWARLLHDALRREVDTADGAPAALPLHLRSAPALPDPRHDGTPAFLAGLLAPVRSGMIVTRADLASIASTAGLGLRAGERRYALEHLLAQGPETVLTALAAMARGAAGRHRARAGWLGRSAEYFAGRADRAAELLDELTSERATEDVAGHSVGAPGHRARPGLARAVGAPGREPGAPRSTSAP